MDTSRIWQRVLGAAVVGVVLAALQAPSSARPAAEQLPNLVALPPFDLQIGATDDASPSDPTSRAIRFATGAANRSDFALELTGQPTSPTEATAHQCTAWAGPRVCSQREQVGLFSWHPQHGHYHFEDFALYQLRKLRANGAPDMRKRGLVATSGKVSFCIIDVEQDESRGALYTLPYPLYYSCLAGFSMQGISPGWKDIYGDSTPGQQIPLEGIEDGDYALISVIDPLDRLLESDDSDNRALTQLRLSKSGTQVEVLCEQEPGAAACGVPPRPTG